MIKILYSFLLVFMMGIGSLYSQFSVEELLEQVETTVNDSEKVALLSQLFAMHIYSDPEKAKTFADEVLSYSQKAAYQAGRAQGHMNIGVWHYLRGEFSKAEVQCEKALGIATAIRDPIRMAKCLNNLGSIYRDKGNYEGSVDYYIKAMKIHEELGDKNGMAQLYNNIGIVHYYLGHVEKAIDNFQLALRLLRELGDAHGVASGIMNVASIYDDQGKEDTAMTYYEEALAMFIGLNEQHYIAECKSNIGSIYLANEHGEEALGYFIEALEIKKALEDFTGVANNLTLIGQVYGVMNNYPKAIEYYNESLELYKEAGFLQNEKELNGLLALAYGKVGEYRKAFELQLVFAKLQDSLLTEASHRQITEIETKYETEQKEKEIVMQALEIDKKNAEVSKKNAQRNAFIAGFGFVLILAILILRGYRQKKKINEQLFHKNLQIEEQNTEIMDSIRYAKRIQEAILPPPDTVSNFLEDAFVMYKSKDIVSGDFYWMEENKNKVLFAAVDCTGHGVPGAFMSIVGHTGLNQAVNEQNLTDPGQILESLNSSVNETLRKREDDSNVRDGMDIALCTLEPKTRKLEFAGANNPLYRISNGELTEIKGTKQPIGQQQTKPFESHNVDLKEGDLIYIFTDGYADQFGGPKGKKFKYKPFKELLLSIADKPMSEQGTIIEERFEEWRGELEQIDDVCIIGVRV